MSRSRAHCPGCGNRLPAEAIDTDTGEIDCPDCGHHTELPELIQEFADLEAVPGIVTRSEVSESDYESLEVDRAGDALRLEVSWFEWFFVLVGFMGTAGMAFGVTAVWLALTAKGTVGARLAFAGVGSGFFAIGAGVFYRALAAFVNSTTIRLRDGQLSVEYGPLPWWGETEFDADTFDQVYCTYSGGAAMPGEGSRTSYTVHAILKQGGVCTIVEGVTEQIDALGIEKEIEEWLDIEDRDVEGEVGG